MLSYTSQHPAYTQQQWRDTYEPPHPGDRSSLNIGTFLNVEQFPKPPGTPPIPQRSPKRRTIIAEHNYNTLSRSNSGDDSASTTPDDHAFRQRQIYARSTSDRSSISHHSAPPPSLHLSPTLTHPATQSPSGAPAPTTKRTTKLLARMFPAIGATKFSSGPPPPETGLNALHKAVLRGDISRLHFLLSTLSAADLAAKRRGCTGHEETVLYLAVAGGDVAIIATLLDAGALVDQPSVSSYHRLTALHRAVLDARIDIVQLLLHHNADIHCQDLAEKTPLHMAAERGFVEIADLLIHHGARVDFVASFGMTPLFLAVKGGWHRVASLLVSHGADVHRGSGEWKDNTLIHAALRAPHNPAQNQNREACLTLLLEAGADVDVFDKAGFTGLHVAAMRGLTDAARVLVEWGADALLLSDPPRFAENGKVVLRHTALEMAYKAKRQDPKMIKLLVQAGEAMP